MSDAPALTRDRISAVIAGKAWKDEAFRRAVLANPNAIYEQQLGRPVPGGVTIKVLEDTPDTVHFVIPARPVPSGELSDEDLETVAGGTTNNPLVSLGIAVSLSVTVIAATVVSASLAVKHDPNPMTKW